MNQNLVSLVYVSIIALYIERGIVYAIAFGCQNGMTTQEVMSLIEYYENQREAARQGLI